MIIQGCTSGCTAGTYTVAINTVTNPINIPSNFESLIIDMTDSSQNIISEGQIAYGSIPELEPNAIITASVERGSEQVSAQVHYLFTFTLVNDLASNEYVRVIMPKAQATVPPTLTCGDPGSSTTYPCSRIYDDTTYWYVDVTGLSGSIGDSVVF